MKGDQWILPVVRSKSYRQKYTSKDLNMATITTVIVPVSRRAAWGLLSSTDLYVSRCTGYSVNLYLIQYIPVSEPKHIHKTQKADLVSGCWSLSQNHLISPLSRAVSCSEPQALLDQGLWCWPARGQHSRPAASGQQHHQDVSVIYLDPNPLKDC